MRVGIQKFYAWWNHSVDFEKAYNPRSNAFGILRLVLASLVIFSHTLPLASLGSESVAFLGRQDTLGGVAVKGFFILSGFLITASFFSSRNVIDYLWKRFLRIMPAFWISLLAVAFIFAPLFYYFYNRTLTGFDLGADLGPIDYITRNFFLEMKLYRVGDLVSELSVPAFNGSLWTLIYEAKAYIFIAFLGVFGILKHRQVVLGITIALLGLYYARLSGVDVSKPIPYFSDIYNLRLLLYFMMGSVWYLYRDKMTISNKFFSLSIVIMLISFHQGFYAVASPIFYTYILMYLVVNLPIRSIERHGDYSYGVYIYAFPIQQSLVLVGFQSMGYWIFSVVALIFSLAAAYFSYHLIEKQAMRLKGLPVRIMDKLS